MVRLRLHDLLDRHPRLVSYAFVACAIAVDLTLYGTSGASSANPGP